MNCKQGDLAYIIKALRSVNIGRIVTCKELIGKLNQEEPYMWNGEVYSAAISDNHWVVSCASGLETLYGKSKEAVIPDTWLRPIKGDLLDSEEHDTLNIIDEATA
jgi:hypothetical protein